MKKNKSSNNSLGSKILGYLLLPVIGHLVLDALTRNLNKPDVTYWSYVLKVFNGFVKAEIYSALFRTLHVFFIGFLIALILAALIGVLMGRINKIENVLMPSVKVLRPIPSAAIIPLAIAVFSYGSITMKLFIIVYGAFWPMVIHIYHGAKEISPITIESAQTLGKSKSQIMFDVIIPAILPAVFVGARIGLAIGLLLTVTVEIIVLGSKESAGLGYLIYEYYRDFNPEHMISIAILLGGVGFLIDTCFSYLKIIAIPWHEKD